MVKNSDMSAECGIGNVLNAECGVRSAEWTARASKSGASPGERTCAFNSAFHTPHSALSSHPRPRPSPQEPQQDSAGPDLGELLRRRARHPPGGAGEVSA